MTYVLKAGVESFRVVDGPFAGSKYLKGKEYAEVPIGEMGKFEEIRVTSDEKRVTSKTKKTRNS